MRAPLTVNGGLQHWTMLNGVNGVDEDNGSVAAREDGKNGDNGVGELKPIIHNQANGVDGAMANAGGDEDEYLDLVNELSFKDERHKVRK